jgi:type II secretory pathway pseudopilin PulG
MFSKMRSNHHYQIRHESQAGFAMIEVLVGMLIMTLFIGISMQFMVYSSLLKARAQQYSEAMTWIQQDLEQLKYQASGYKSNVLKVAATAASTSIALTSSQNFEVNDKITIGADPTVYTISSIAGNNLTIAPPVSVPSPINAGASQ